MAYWENHQHVSRKSSNYDNADDAYCCYAEPIS